MWKVKMRSLLLCWLGFLIAGVRGDRWPSGSWSIVAKGGNVISRGHALGDIRIDCNGGACRMCDESRCFDRAYQTFMIYEGCPSAACEYGCGELVFGPDDCPICPCGAFSTREPCTSNSDCLSPGGQCKNALCHYPPVSDSSQRACTFSGIYKVRRPKDPKFGSRAQCARPGKIAGSPSLPTETQGRGR